MADFGDKAGELQEHLLNVALTNAKQHETKFTGRCRACEEPIKEGGFCGVECRDFYELLNRRR